MVNYDRAESGQALFEARVASASTARERLAGLDLDIMPTKVVVEGDITTVGAIVRLDQLEELVASGAEVTLTRVVERSFDPDLIRSDDQVAERLAVLEQHREDTQGEAS